MADRALTQDQRDALDRLKLRFERAESGEEHAELCRQEQVILHGSTLYEPQPHSFFAAPRSETAADLPPRSPPSAAETRPSMPSHAIPASAVAFSEILELGLPEQTRNIYLALDAAALTIGEKIKASHQESPAELRAYAVRLEARGLSWLAGQNRDIADAIETDVRLLAIPVLYAEASLPTGIGRTWVTWYSELLRKHINVALMATAVREVA